MSARLTYNVDEAAERLGAAFTVDWLKARVKRGEIPYGKSGNGTGRGGRVYFTEAHLAEIVLKYEHRPESMPAPSRPEDFTPVTRRRRSA